MPSEEGRQVLNLLAEGKIDAEQAYRLLAAIGDVPGRPGPAAPRRPAGPGPAGRMLRIRVTEGGRQKVNIAVPLAVARLGRIGGLSSQLTSRFGLDLHHILRDLDVSAGGKIVDVVDEEGGDRVEIYVE